MELPSPEPALPWRYRTGSLVLLFLGIGPFMLPLVWFHPRQSRAWKAQATALVLAATAALCAATWKSFSLMLENYREMSRLLEAMG